MDLRFLKFLVALLVIASAIALWAMSTSSSTTQASGDRAISEATAIPMTPPVEMPGEDSTNALWRLIPGGDEYELPEGEFFVRPDSPEYAGSSVLAIGDGRNDKKVHNHGDTTIVTLGARNRPFGLGDLIMDGEGQVLFPQGIEVQAICTAVWSEAPIIIKVEADGRQNRRGNYPSILGSDDWILVEVPSRAGLGQIWMPRIWLRFPGGELPTICSPDSY